MSKSPLPVADTHTASPADTAPPADAPKKPWAKPTIRTVDGEVRSGTDATSPRIENGRYRLTS